MSGKKCTICKHYGKNEEDPYVERTVIYDELNTPVTIHLCRSHSVDLFKMGQKKFLLSHHRILVEILSSDEPKFIELLEKTVKSNYNELF